MFIHHVTVQTKRKYGVDPIHGLTSTVEEIIAPGSAQTIVSAEGEFHAADGTFDVSNELGEYCLKQPGWYEGPNPFTEYEPAAQTPKKKAKATA